MKKTYHIYVEYNESDNVDYALRHLNVTPTSIKKMPDDKGSGRADYIVSLSKYELLYLRLACSSGKMKDITNAPQVIFV